MSLGTEDGKARCWDVSSTVWIRGEIWHRMLKIDVGEFHSPRELPWSSCDIFSTLYWLQNCLEEHRHSLFLKFLIAVGVRSEGCIELHFYAVTSCLNVT